jgi:decaprenyl-phosphate phosphoribosyltransferase
MPEDKAFTTNAAVPANPAAAGAATVLRLFDRATALLVSIRPGHWIKNGFLFAPLVFSGHFYDFHDVLLVVYGFVSFCFAASAVYLFNDINDRERDALSVVTKKRPIAAGIVSPRAAAIGALVLLAGSQVISYALGLNFFALLLIYVANNVAYTLFIKNKVIADVISIASGFVLRILAGAALIHVEASQWLIVCTFSLALLLGFGKRRAELFHSPGIKAVSIIYTDAKLDHMTSVSAALSLLSYMLYVVSPESIARFKGSGMIYTVPFVVYGIFRFVAKTQEGKAKDPVHLIYSDRVSVLNVFCWLLTVIIVVSIAYRN